MKLFYRQYGEGPDLVILHGLYGSSDNWVTIAKKISSSFRVILPDLRNHGHSRHNESHDYDSMSSDLHELASDLGFRKFFLAGHSMGGKTAMTFAMKWPEMIDGLPEDYQEILKIFPAAEIKTIKNAGHWLHSDNPEAVKEALLELLNY